MFLTMASARLPCCTTLSRLPRSVSINSVISLRLFSLTLTSARASCSSVMSSAEIPEKLLTKLSGFLDLVRYARCELTKRGELLRLDQTVLRCAQVLQRGGQLARAGFHTFKQTHVLNCDRCLVGECRG